MISHEVQLRLGTELHKFYKLHIILPAIYNDFQIILELSV